LRSTPWGYGITQIVGGLAADRVGGARVLLVGLGLWSLAVTAIPASTLTSAPVTMLVVRGQEA
jgi:ACS family sodium-dependent inorganic phosphate cotransporter